MAVFGGAYLYPFDGHRSPICEAPPGLAFALFTYISYSSIGISPGFHLPLLLDLQLHLS